jgi:hypothetical protein
MQLHNRQSCSFQPTLTLLEGRALPSATATILGSKLDITCDDAGSMVQIRDNGKGAVTAVVKSAGGSVSAAGAGITDIAVHGGPGNDIVDFRTTANLVTALHLHEDLGAGNDYSFMDLYRGVSGGPLNIEVNGGTGADAVLAEFGTINNAPVNFHAALGDGADSCNVVLFNGVSGHSTVNMNVAGQSGPDRVDYNVMGKIDAAAKLNIHADNTTTANDRLIVRYRGELDGAFNLDVDKAAAMYGVQALFALDAASTGTLTTIVRDGTNEFGSSLQVTDHTGGTKVTILDRLENILTEAPGTKVTVFNPAAI